jgi:hypothetical protein
LSGERSPRRPGERVLAIANFLLVGGASLDAPTFSQIVKAAQEKE